MEEDNETKTEQTEAVNKQLRLGVGGRVRISMFLALFGRRMTVTG